MELGRFKPQKVAEHRVFATQPERTQESLDNLGDPVDVVSQHLEIKRELANYDPSPHTKFILPKFTQSPLPPTLRPIDREFMKRFEANMKEHVDPKLRELAKWRSDPENNPDVHRRLKSGVEVKI